MILEACCAYAGWCGSFTLLSVDGALFAVSPESVYGPAMVGRVEGKIADHLYMLMNLNNIAMQRVARNINGHIVPACTSCGAAASRLVLNKQSAVVCECCEACC